MWRLVGFYSSVITSFVLYESETQKAYCGKVDELLPSAMSAVRTRLDAKAVTYKTTQHLNPEGYNRHSLHLPGLFFHLGVVNELSRK